MLKDFRFIPPTFDDEQVEGTEPLQEGTEADGDNHGNARIKGYDAPETYKNAEYAAEADGQKRGLWSPTAGLSAEGRSFLAKGGATATDTGERGFYGRPLVDASTSKGTRVADEMVAAGLAIPTDDQSYAAWASAGAREALGFGRSSYAELDALGDVAASVPTVHTELRHWTETATDNTQGRGFGDAVARGVDSVQQDFGGFLQFLGRQTGSKELEDYGSNVVAYNDLQLSLNQREIARFDDVESVSDAITYAIETTGELAPQLLPDIIAGVVTGGSAVVAKAALTQSLKGAGKLAVKAGGAGAAATSMASSVGGMSNTLADEGIVDDTVAGVTGVAMGLLDILPVFDAVKQLNKTAGISDDVTRTMLQRLGHVAAEGARTGTLEGATSLAQGLIEQAGLAAADPDYAWSQETTMNVIDQMIRGVLGGGAATMGGTAAIEGYQHAANTLGQYDARRREQIDAALAGDTPELEDAAMAADMASDFGDKVALGRTESAKTELGGASTNYNSRRTAEGKDMSPKATPMQGAVDTSEYDAIGDVDQLSAALRETEANRIALEGDLEKTENADSKAELEANIAALRQREDKLRADLSTAQVETESYDAKEQGKYTEARAKVEQLSARAVEIETRLDEIRKAKKGPDNLPQPELATEFVRLEKELLDTKASIKKNKAVYEEAKPEPVATPYGTKLSREADRVALESNTRAELDSTAKLGEKKEISPSEWHRVLKNQGRVRPEPAAAKNADDRWEDSGLSPTEIEARLPQARTDAAAALERMQVADQNLAAAKAALDANLAKTKDNRKRVRERAAVHTEGLQAEVERLTAEADAAFAEKVAHDDRVASLEDAINFHGDKLKPAKEGKKKRSSFEDAPEAIHRSNGTTARDEYYAAREALLKGEEEGLPERELAKLETEFVAAREKFLSWQVTENAAARAKLTDKTKKPKSIDVRVKDEPTAASPKKEDAAPKVGDVINVAEPSEGVGLGAESTPRARNSHETDMKIRLAVTMGDKKKLVPLSKVEDFMANGAFTPKLLANFLASERNPAGAVAYRGQDRKKAALTPEFVGAVIKRVEGHKDYGNGHHKLKALEELHDRVDNGEIVTYGEASDSKVFAIKGIEHSDLLDELAPPDWKKMYVESLAAQGGQGFQTSDPDAPKKAKRQTKADAVSKKAEASSISKAQAEKAAEQSDAANRPFADVLRQLVPAINRHREATTAFIDRMDTAKYYSPVGIFERFTDAQIAELKKHKHSTGAGSLVFKLSSLVMEYGRSGHKSYAIEQTVKELRQKFGITSTKPREVFDQAIKKLGSVSVVSNPKGKHYAQEFDDANSLLSAEARKAVAFNNFVGELLQRAEEGGDEERLMFDLQVAALGPDYLGRSREYVMKAMKEQGLFDSGIEGEAVDAFEDTDSIDDDGQVKHGKLTTAFDDIFSTPDDDLESLLIETAKDNGIDPMFMSSTELMDAVGELDIPETKAAIQREQAIYSGQVHDLIMQLGSTLVLPTVDAKRLADTLAALAVRLGGVRSKGNPHLYPATISVSTAEGRRRYESGRGEAADRKARPFNRNLNKDVTRALAAQIFTAANTNPDTETFSQAVELIRDLLTTNGLIGDFSQPYTNGAKGTNDVAAFTPDMVLRMKSNKGFGIEAMHNGERVRLSPAKLTKFGMSRTQMDLTQMEDDATGAATQQSLRRRIYEGFLGGVSTAIGAGFDIDVRKVPRNTVVYFHHNNPNLKVTWGELLDYMPKYRKYGQKQVDETYKASMMDWLRDNKDIVEQSGFTEGDYEAIVNAATKGGKTEKGARIDSSTLSELQQAKRDAPQVEGKEAETPYSSLAMHHEATDTADWELKKNAATDFINGVVGQREAARIAKKADQEVHKALAEGASAPHVPKGRSAQINRKAKNGMRVDKAKGLWTAWIRSTRTRLARINHRVAEAVDRVVLDSDSQFIRFRSMVEKAVGKDLEQALDDLNRGVDSEQAKALRKVLDEVHAYAKQYDPNLRDPKVVARVDREALLADREGFLRILKEGKVNDPAKMYEELVASYGALDTNVDPKAAVGKRALQELAPLYAQLRDQGFIRGDADTQLTNYLRTVTHRAEWAKEFGRTVDGVFDVNYGFNTLTSVLQPEDIGQVKELVSGALGNLGRDNYAPWLRKTNTALLTLQTATVLWLAGVASIPELGTAVIRSRSDADELGKRVSSLFRAHSVDYKEARELTELFGLVSRSTTEHTLAELVGSGQADLNSTSRSVSNFVFKWSGQNLIAEMSRVSGAVIGRDYLAKNATKALAGDSVAAERITELGITPEAVVRYLELEKANDGRPVALSYTEPRKDAQEQEDVESYHMAMSRFVEGSVAVPNRMDVPHLFNDPRWVLLTSLKKFYYGYWQTVHKGMYRDAKQRTGMSKMMPFVIGAAAILPLAALAEWLREELKYPSLFGAERKVELDTSDWVEKVLGASGGLGPAQAVVSALTVSEYSGSMLTAMMGPSVNLGLDIIAGHALDNPARFVPIVGQQPQLRAEFNKGVKSIYED